MFPEGGRESGAVLTLHLAKHLEVHGRHLHHHLPDSMGHYTRYVPTAAAGTWPTNCFPVALLSGNPERTALADLTEEDCASGAWAGAATTGVGEGGVGDTLAALAVTRRA